MTVYCFLIDSKHILSIPERPSILPETEAVLSYPCPRQLLISKVRFPVSVRIVSAKAFPDKPNSQCKKPKNSCLISPS